MTSTNDEKEVKNHETSSLKGKAYYIELYKSLETRLSGEADLHERTESLSEAWRIIHQLCLHATATTHPHLITWLQRNSAHTVLQSEWQTPSNKSEHTVLEAAIDAFIRECQSAIAVRNGTSQPWESQLLQWAEWFKSILSNPWEHPVLDDLVNHNGEKSTDEDVLRWSRAEQGVTVVARVRALVAHSRQHAQRLVSALLDRVRARQPAAPDDLAAPDDPPANDDHPAPDDCLAPDTPKTGEGSSTSRFTEILESEAGFTKDVWEILTDIEFVLLYKRKRSRCIELAKATPLSDGYKLAERLRNRLETSPPGEHKLWENAKNVATLVAQMLIARCMMVPVCSGGPRLALYCCARSLARLVPRARLSPETGTLAALAHTARHLHTFAAAIDKECGPDMKSVVCELYIRAITAGMNELENLKLDSEKECEARCQERTLAAWFTRLGAVLGGARLAAECALTAFSVHPAPHMYHALVDAPPFVRPVHVFAIDTQDKESVSEFGSWASDSRSQTNLVKTSETLNLKQTQQKANVLSTAVLTEGEAIGLTPELSHDLAVLLSGPRLKTLSWDMDREILLSNCRQYMERTHGGTRVLTTELKYLNLDPSKYQHLPEEDDGENDIYYGIEKGYEHLVEVQDAEIWQDPFIDPERTESACSEYDNEEILIYKKKKSRRRILSSDEEDKDPLSFNVDTNKYDEKKERPHSKERSIGHKPRRKTKSIDRESNRSKEHSQESIKSHNSRENVEITKEKKQRKKKNKDKSQVSGTLSSLLGMQVVNIEDSEKKTHKKKGRRRNDSMDKKIGLTNDDDQKSPTSLNAEENKSIFNVGLLSMDDVISREKQFQSSFNVQHERLPSATVTSSIATMPSRLTASTSSLFNRTAIPNYNRHIPPSTNWMPKTDIKQSLCKNNHDQVNKKVRQTIKSLLKARSLSKINCDSSTKLSDHNKNVNVPNSDCKRVFQSEEKSGLITKEMKSPTEGHIKNAKTNLCSNSSLLNQPQLKSQNVEHIKQQPRPHNYAILNIPQVKRSVSQHQQHFENFIKTLPKSTFDANVDHTNIGKSSVTEKREIRPMSKVNPVPMLNKNVETLQTSQCAKPTLTQNKLDNAPHTFARLSYMHKNKQTEDHLKQNTEVTRQSVLEKLAADLDKSVVNYKIKKAMVSQRKNSSLLGDKNNSNVKSLHNFESNYTKYSPKVAATGAEKHPMLTCMLQKGTPPNILSQKPKEFERYKDQINMQTEHSKFIPNSLTDKKSHLSELDQYDLISLLRQKSNLRAPNIRQQITHKPLSKCVTEMSTKLTINPSVSTKSFTNHVQTKPLVSSINVATPSNIEQTKTSENNIVEQTMQINNKFQHNMTLNNVKSNLNSKKPHRVSKNLKVYVNKDPDSEYTPVYDHPQNVDEKQQDWESVMKKILSHKTPNRGPTALEIALQRDPQMLNRNQTYIQNAPTKGKIQEKQFPSGCPATNASLNIVNCDVKNETSLNVLNEKRVTQIFQSEKINDVNSFIQTNLSAGTTRSDKNNLIKIPLDMPTNSSKGVQQDYVQTKKENLTKFVQSNNFQFDSLSKNSDLKKISVEKPKVIVTNIKKIKPLKSHRTNPNASSVSPCLNTKLVDPSKTEISIKHKKVESLIQPPIEASQNCVEVKTMLLQDFPKKDDLNELLNQSDPFISGLQNSDYDLLEELMDDDLRKEIGELSSDEETDSKINSTIKNVKNANVAKAIDVKRIQKSTNVTKCSYEVPVIVNKHQIMSNLTPAIDNDKGKLIKHVTTGAPVTVSPNVMNVQNSNVLSSSSTHTEILMKKLATQNVDVQKKFNISNNTCNQNHTNNLYMTPTPQPSTVPKVVVLSTEMIYNPCPKSQIQESALNTNMDYSSKNYITMNSAANVTCYPTTRLTTPIVKQGVIDNTHCAQSFNTKRPSEMNQTFVQNQLLVPKTPVETIKIYQEKGQKVPLQVGVYAKVHEKIPTTVESKDLHTMNKPNNMVVIRHNSSKLERRVLSQVQEKQSIISDVKVDNKSVKHLKHEVDDVDYNSINIERLKKKRLAIINREISHRCFYPPIALGYESLRGTESNLLLTSCNPLHIDNIMTDKEELQDENLLPGLKTLLNLNDNGAHKNKNSDTLKLQHDENTDQHINNHQENNSKECRTILLRSSYKFPEKTVHNKDENKTKKAKVKLKDIQGIKSRCDSQKYWKNLKYEKEVLNESPVTFRSVSVEKFNIGQRGITDGYEPHAVSPIKNKTTILKPDEICDKNDSADKNILNNGSQIQLSGNFKDTQSATSAENINDAKINNATIKNFGQLTKSVKTCNDRNVKQSLDFCKNIVNKGNIQNNANDNNTSGIINRENIKIEELPQSDDPLKKVIRVKLPNGKSYRATVYGKVNANFNALFKDPQIKSILLNKGFESSTRYTLNIKQYSTSTSCTNRIVATDVNQTNNPSLLTNKPETINLVSDDEDHPDLKMATEFGDYKISGLDNKTFYKHQQKFSQKSYVRLKRCATIGVTKNKKFSKGPSIKTSLKVNASNMSGNVINSAINVTQKSNNFEDYTDQTLPVVEKYCKIVETNNAPNSILLATKDTNVVEHSLVKNAQCVGDANDLEDIYNTLTTTREDKITSNLNIFGSYPVHNIPVLRKNEESSLVNRIVNVNTTEKYSGIIVTNGTTNNKIQEIHDYVGTNSDVKDTENILENNSVQPAPIRCNNIITEDIVNKIATNSVVKSIDGSTINENCTDQSSQILVKNNEIVKTLDDIITSSVIKYTKEFKVLQNRNESVGLNCNNEIHNDLVPNSEVEVTEDPHNSKNYQNAQVFVKKYETVKTLYDIINTENSDTLENQTEPFVSSNNEEIYCDLFSNSEDQVKKDYITSKNCSQEIVEIVTENIDSEKTHEAITKTNAADIDKCLSSITPKVKKTNKIDKKNYNVAKVKDTEYSSTLVGVVPQEEKYINKHMETTDSLFANLSANVISHHSPPYCSARYAPIIQKSNNSENDTINLVQNLETEVTMGSNTIENTLIQTTLIDNNSPEIVNIETCIKEGNSNIIEHFHHKSYTEKLNKTLPLNTDEKIPHIEDKNRNVSTAGEKFEQSITMSEFCLDHVAVSNIIPLKTLNDYTTETVENKLKDINQSYDKTYSNSLEKDKKMFDVRSEPVFIQQSIIDSEEFSKSNEIVKSDVKIIYDDKITEYHNIDNHKVDTIETSKVNETLYNGPTQYISEVIEIVDSSNDSIQVVDDSPAIDVNPHTNIDLKISNFKNLLLQELAIEDGNVEKVSEVESSSTNETEKNVKECVVKITKCDNILKKYEIVKNTNRSCFIKLVRCDVLNKTVMDKGTKEKDVSLVKKLSDRRESTDDLINIGVDDNSRSSTPILKRSGSFSILNDFAIYDEETCSLLPTNNDYDRSSPVIDVFDAIVSVKSRMQSTTCYSDSLNIKKNEPLVSCFSEVFLTKRDLYNFFCQNQRDIEACKLGGHFEASQSTSNVCIASSFTERKLSDDVKNYVPSLMTIMVKYIKDNPIVYQFNYFKTSTIQSLKRKLKLKDNLTNHKIFKSNKMKYAVAGDIESSTSKNAEFSMIDKIYSTLGVSPKGLNDTVERFSNDRTGENKTEVFQCSSHIKNENKVKDNVMSSEFKEYCRLDIDTADTTMNKKSQVATNGSPESIEPMVPTNILGLKEDMCEESSQCDLGPNSVNSELNKNSCYTFPYNNLEVKSNLLITENTKEDVFENKTECIISFEDHIIKSNKDLQDSLDSVYKGECRNLNKHNENNDTVLGVFYHLPDSINRVNIDGLDDSIDDINQKLKFDTTTEKVHDNINFNLSVPTITYRNKLKRKKQMRNWGSTEKKYRKSKNIDYSKSTTNSNELGYVKEYSRLLNYCSSVKFSYSLSFHKEHVEVQELLKNWPINNYCINSCEKSDVDVQLFSDVQVNENINDPTQQTLSEEISANFEEVQISTNKVKHLKLDMGFGEGSGRVIRNSEDYCSSKFSAATLSDVKQTQPFSMSENCKRNIISRNIEDQIEKIKNCMKFVNLRDKVRSFFKNTSFELTHDFIKEKPKCKFTSPRLDNCYFPFDLCSTDYIAPAPIEVIVQVVQVGQLPVSTAAQNPVTCDPRVTQVSDASPSQFSAENSPNNESPSSIKTEYTELTTADLTLPLVPKAEPESDSPISESQMSTNMSITDKDLLTESEIKTEVNVDIVKEEDLSNEVEDTMEEHYKEYTMEENNQLSTLTNASINNVDYTYDRNADCSIETEQNINVFETSDQNDPHCFNQEKQRNGSVEKTDQIAHAMNAAGITTSADNMNNSRAQALANMLSQKIRQGSVNTATSTNNFSKTSINAMAIQQALAQILPPPLNQTNATENGQQSSNTPVTSQVLHIVQGKNSGNQLTLVDNTQQSVISTPNATQVLHIVQNKSGASGNVSSGASMPQTNSFSGLSLVDTGLQQGGSQLLHIVNTGNQKNNSAGQLIKRVNLLTNITNVQGSNEQKMVQFVCKSADGKAIQLNAPHQRSMVLRLQPIETPNVQSTHLKSSETQESNSSANSANSNILKETVNPQQEIKSRSVYEENYAKFIQNSSNKQPVLEKSTSLPKFNQAFGKQVYQDSNQKQNEISNNNSHLQPSNSNENTDCQSVDNAMNMEHLGQINSPPLLLRKSPSQTSQPQSSLGQQVKPTIAPMNIQTMHGGVIYTRQIPVNIGGGQTINLITVPSTELVDETTNQKQSDMKFINQNEMEPSIIKIVPQNQSATNTETSEEGNNQIGVTNENSQPQPVLTQMRIKLPMLSKNPQMVPGARVMRPSFFQIQRNVIGGANQPVYQQLVLTAAPPLGQQLRIPQTRAKPIKVPTESQSESQMSSSTLEQLREFDMVLEQVKERSTVQPNGNANTTFPKLHTQSNDSPDGAVTANAESTQQVLYSIGNNQSVNVAYVNRKPTVTPTTSTFVRSPDSSGVADSPTSSTHAQIPHTITSETVGDVPTQPKPAKVGSKSKSRPKSSSNPTNSMKISSVPPKTSSQKPLEDEQTTQRILYILAEYKEQVENSPDKDKPAPRRRSNPPSNPSGSSKRKKSSSGSRRSGGREMSPIHGDDTCRTMGSEDSSCGTSQGDCNESCLDSHSPQDSPRKVVRKLTFENETPVTQPRPQPQRNIIVADGQTITVARGTAGKPTTAVLMPANYILPVSMVKGGQQIAIVTNRGPKLLTVGGADGGATNALLLQRLIGPAGLKPVLARPGVRHVRLPTAALHNLQAFNLTTTTAVHPPDSTASSGLAPTPDLVDTRATSSPWTERESQEVKPERSSSPEGSEPWNLQAAADPRDYTYEEPRSDMDRTVLDSIQDRYSPDMEAQRIFDKMFDVDSKKSYIVDSHDDSPRCGYDIDASDCEDKGYHQVVHKRDGSSHRHHRLAHVSTTALRHKYAILEHELRLQKSLSEECEDLGVDSPSASELFPEAELLFAASPAHEQHEHGQHSHTRRIPAQPTILSQSTIPQPDMDDQIATDHLLQNEFQDQQELDLGLGLGVGIVTVSDGLQAAALDHEEFARSHPNTTFHSEPTDEGEVPPFTISSSAMKNRHITSTIFHSSNAPATVLVTTPQTTVISQAIADPGGIHNAVKYTDIDNMINSLPGPHNNDINLSSVLVKDDGLTRFDSILNDSRELHLSNTASAIVHAGANATQVIRRVCYDDKRENDRFLLDEPDALIAGDDAKMVAEDSSRDATLESMADDRSSPERHAELYWESNSASEPSESRRPLDSSSDSDKCCKSPSLDESNSESSGGHVRLDSVIKEARRRSRCGSADADGSSADDTQPPLRTYPAKRGAGPGPAAAGASVSGKTRAGEPGAGGSAAERRRASARASARGVVKRGCHCCGGDPPPLRSKKPRQRKLNMDFS